jgi:hypothetical protein
MSFYNVYGYNDGVSFSDMTEAELVKLGFKVEEDYDQPVVVDQEELVKKLQAVKARLAALKAKH